MTRKNNNVTIICNIQRKSALIPKRLQAFGVFFYCHSRRDGREQRSKNGGAPWLPERCMENNDERSPAPTARKSARNRHETPEFTRKRRSGYPVRRLGRRNEQFRSKKNQEAKTSTKAP